MSDRLNHDISALKSSSKTFIRGKEIATVKGVRANGFLPAKITESGGIVFDRRSAGDDITINGIVVELRQGETWARESWKLWAGNSGKCRARDAWKVVTVHVGDAWSADSFLLTSEHKSRYFW